jgi:hypothetical protein
MTRFSNVRLVVAMPAILSILSFRAMSVDHGHDIVPGRERGHDPGRDHVLHGAKASAARLSAARRTLQRQNESTVHRPGEHCGKQPSGGKNAHSVQFTLHVCGPHRRPQLAPLGQSHSAPCSGDAQMADAAHAGSGATQDETPHKRTSADA